MRFSRFACFLLMILFAAPAFAQQLGKAPFFSSFSPHRLSQQLTKGLDDDSLKLRSIYLWMTRHIKYDAKGFSQGPYPSFDPKIVLRRRKAVCLGYSTLLNALCREAGIWSETVTGYDKGEGFEENDTLYQGHHAWSAVYLNESWRLLDVTFASGYLHYKETFGSRLLRLIIWHRTRVVKLAFKRRRDDFYYLTDPRLLVFDHLPDDPAWQLLPKTVPVDSFQVSDVAVYRAVMRPSPHAQSYMDSVTTIMADADTTHRQLRSGLRAAEFNPRNHSGAAVGYNNHGNTYLKQAGDESRFDDQRLKRCRTAEALYDSSAKYGAVSVRELDEELHHKLQRYKRQHDEATTFYHDLMARDRYDGKVAAQLLKQPKLETSRGKIISSQSRLYIYNAQLRDTAALDSANMYDLKLQVAMAARVEGLRDSLRAYDPAHTEEAVKRLRRWSDSINVQYNWLMEQVYPKRLMHPQLDRIDTVSHSDMWILNDHLSRYTAAVDAYMAVSETLFVILPQQQIDLTEKTALVLLRRMQLSRDTGNVGQVERLYRDLATALAGRQDLYFAQAAQIGQLKDFLKVAALAEKSLLLLRTSQLKLKAKTIRNQHKMYTKNVRDNLRSTKANQASAKKLEKYLLAKIKREKAAR